MSPVAPVRENEEGESDTLTGDVLDTADYISSETTGSPVNDKQFCAQLSNRTSNTGDAGATGDIFRSYFF